MMESQEGGKPKAEFVGVRLSRPDRRLLEIAAEEKGVTLSNLLRNGGREEALKALGKAAFAEAESS